MIRISQINGKICFHLLRIETSKRRSDFDQLRIDPKRKSNKSILQKRNIKNQRKVSSTPDQYDEAKQ